MTPPHDDGRDPLAGMDPLGHAGELPFGDREHILLQRQVNALLTGHHHLAQQMTELSMRVVKVETAQQTLHADVALMRGELKANTEMTQRSAEAVEKLSEVMTAFRVAGKVGNGIVWLAKVGAAAGLIWASVLVALHVKPPQG